MRDKQLQALRPKVDSFDSESTEIEKFQNKTLRPILKFQDELTAALLEDSGHFQKMKDKIDVSDDKAYREMVGKYLTSNVVFKHKIIGIVLGMMTVEELAFYNANATELNKRIMNMQLERYASRS